jgi:hypothetical protein
LSINAELTLDTGQFNRNLTVVNYSPKKYYAQPPRPRGHVLVANPAMDYRQKPVFLCISGANMGAPELDFCLKMTESQFLTRMIFQARSRAVRRGDGLQNRPNFSPGAASDRSRWTSVEPIFKHVSRPRRPIASLKETGQTAVLSCAKSRERYPAVESDSPALDLEAGVVCSLDALWCRRSP